MKGTSRSPKAELIFLSFFPPPFFPSSFPPFFLSPQKQNSNSGGLQQYVCVYAVLGRDPISQKTYHSKFGQFQQWKEEFLWSQNLQKNEKNNSMKLVCLVIGCRCNGTQQNPIPQATPAYKSSPKATTWTAHNKNQEDKSNIMNSNLRCLWDAQLNLQLGLESKWTQKWRMWEDLRRMKLASLFSVPQITYLKTNLKILCICGLNLQA